MSGAPKTSRASRVIGQATAAFMVVVLLCIPVLSRLNRRLTSVDSGTGYRYSRSVAVPLERYTLAPMLASTSTSASAEACTTASDEHVAPLDRRPPACLFVPPAIAVRAPPRR